ncbi:hypothetical protein Tco_1316814 [Tanacetum coccineum]
MLRLTRMIKELLMKKMISRKTQRSHKPKRQVSKFPYNVKRHYKILKNQDFELQTEVDMSVVILLITFYSVHSEARSWSIPSEDPYEEATRQLFEQAPCSPRYVPEDHIPVYIPEPEHPEDLTWAVRLGESSAAAAAERVSKNPLYETRLRDTTRWMDDRALLRARVNMLYRDRPFHRRTALLMEEEARVSRAAWAQSMDACDQVRSEGISLRTTVMAQQSEITELQAADRRRQTVISDLLKADHRRQRQLVEALKIVKSLKTQMIELQRQQGPAKDPAEPELPEEASSSS